VVVGLACAMLGACRAPASEPVPPVLPARDVPGSRPKAVALGRGLESPFQSPEACSSRLAQGDRAPRTPGRARIGSWNIRWFPDGKPGKRAQKSGTDIAWLSCAIAWLDLDALVVEEFKTHAATHGRVDELLALLDRHTGGAWQARFDDCPNSAGQHVGVLFDSKRVAARAWQTFASLNPRGQACRDQLRPGFGGYLRFPGGLDLHLIAVHLKSGQKRRAFELRRRSIEGLFQAYQQSNAEIRDSDVLLAGDFNTMGCGNCSPKVEAEAELVALSEQLHSLEQPFRRVTANLSCSHYFHSRPTLLDHFVASSGLRELPPERISEVFGDCADHACRGLPSGQRRGAFAEALSDHCPIVIELDDVDAD
jgi:hypothetical protein